MPEIAITEEMITHFNKRTNHHIELVNKYLDKMLKANLPGIDKKILEEEKATHDDSKFDDPEVIPYVLLTWRYLQRDTGNEKFDYPQNIQDKITEITEIHVKNNKHHPEYWSEQDTPAINPNDRDKPPEVKIECYKMPLSYVMCMVADWLAMGEERGNSAKDWADDNIDVRWLFTDNQKKMIYDVIDTWQD